MVQTRINDTRDGYELHTELDSTCHVGMMGLHLLKQRRGPVQRLVVHRGLPNGETRRP